MGFSSITQIHPQKCDQVTLIMIPNSRLELFIEFIHSDGAENTGYYILTSFKHLMTSFKHLMTSSRHVTIGPPALLQSCSQVEFWPKWLTCCDRSFNRPTDRLFCDFHLTQLKKKSFHLFLSSVSIVRNCSQFGFIILDVFEYPDLKMTSAVWRLCLLLGVLIASPGKLSSFLKPILVLTDFLVP